MKLFGFGGQEITTYVAEIHVWFDRWDTKVWYTTLFDESGNSIDESATSHLKEYAKTYARAMCLAAAEAQGNAPILKVFTREGHL